METLTANKHKSTLKIGTIEPSIQPNEVTTQQKQAVDLVPTNPLIKYPKNGLFGLL